MLLDVRMNRIINLYSEGSYNLEIKCEESFILIEFYKNKNIYPLSKVVIHIDLDSNTVCKFNITYDVVDFTAKELGVYTSLDLTPCKKNLEEKEALEDDSVQNSREDQYLCCFTTGFSSPDSFKEESFLDWVYKLMDSLEIDHDDLKGMISSNILYDLKTRSKYPTRQTVASIILGIGLDFYSAQELMNKVGYHLSEYIEYDRIIIDAVKNELGIYEANLKLLEVRTKELDNSGNNGYKYIKNLLGPKEVQKESIDKVFE